MGSGNDILDMYIYETGTLLEQLETIVLEAEQANTFSQENVNEIFRIMHTIKGSSAMMEFDTLARVAHRIEDMFFIIREGTMSVVPDDARPALFDVVFQSIDYFRGEVDKVEAGEPLDKDIDSFMSNINTLIAKIKGEEPPDAEPTAAEPAASSAPTAAAPVPAPAGAAGFPHALRVNFEEGCGMESLRAFMLVTAVKDVVNEADFIFDPADVENDPSTSGPISESGFHLMFKTEGDREAAAGVIKTAGSVESCEPYELAVPAAAPAPAPAPAPAASAPAPAPAPAPAAAPAASAPAAAPAAAPATAAAPAAQQQHSKETLIRGNQSKLDQLSAVVGEIVITESMVTSSPDLKGLSLDAFSKSARELRKLTDELQDVSMSLRMVPVSSVFQKMTRIVRDMTKKLNRPCKLTLIGENTEVDKTIVDSIGDPIMHMVRNSMDHGIEETQEERVAAGKDPVGEIILSARDTGSEVIIEIVDDGRGVNDEAVLNKAIRQGIASPDVEYSHKEILNFLLAPGFSTNTEVTEFSGRGVGMDVVKKGVEDLGGTVSISSQLGHGMTTTIRIPLTMAIMDAMEVSVGGSIFTIPISNIVSTMKVSAGDVIHDSSSGEIIKIQGSFYHIVRAKELYQLQDGFSDIEDGVLIWLEAGDHSYCLLVDELLGQQQVVVKQLPAYVNSYNIKSYGINGCTLRSDGSISIILDVASLYTAARGM